MCLAPWFLLSTTLNRHQVSLCCPSPLFSALLNLNLLGKPPQSDPQHATPSPHRNRDLRLKRGVACPGYERWNVCAEGSCWRKAGGLISLVGGVRESGMDAGSAGGGREGQTARWTQSYGGLKRGGQTDSDILLKTKTLVPVSEVYSQQLRREHLCATASSPLHINWMLRVEKKTDSGT